MKYHLRPYKKYLPALFLAMTVAWAPLSAQSTQFGQALHRLDPFLSHSSAQGYLGVLVTDVDNDSMNKLKLKDTRGAMITLIDHDAPAGSSLRVNDVVLEINGQRVEGAEQFSRILREIPAGRTVAIALTRDGAPVAVNVQLVDRKELQKAWKEIGNRNEGTSSVSPAKTILPGGDAGLPHFHPSLFGSTLKVGAMVEPLTSQMADYLSVPNGVMIKQIARKSEADAAGLKPYDVVIRVGNEPITTMADWDRAIRANEGKSVAITILRDRKQQTVTLQVDSKHKGEVEYRGLLPDGPEPAAAEALALLRPDTAAGSADPANGAQPQAETRANPSDAGTCLLDDEQWSQLRQQMDEFRKNFKPEDFGVDAKQMADLRNQMAEFRQPFKAENFHIDTKQVDELKKQMEEFRKSFKAENFGIDPKQMDEFRRQMEEFRKSMPQQMWHDQNAPAGQRPEAHQMAFGKGQQA